MINRICSICKEYISDTWTLVISDDKTKKEISGCKRDIDQLETKIKSIKNHEKKTVKQILKEINYNDN